MTLDDSPDGIPRRRFLGVSMGISTVSTFTKPVSQFFDTNKRSSVTQSATTETIHTSFEQEDVGSQSPADPFFLFSNNGLHEVTDSESTDGNQAFQTGQARLGNPSAFAVELDITHYETISLDVFTVNNNPNNGNIKISLDGAGYGNQKTNIWDLPTRVLSERGYSNYRNVDQWYEDIEVDLSDYDGERTLTFWVDGDNNVIWDNIRIEPGDDATGDSGATQTAGEWPTFQFDQYNSGHNPAGIGPSELPDLDWSFELDAYPPGAPVIDNGVIYAGTENALYALRAGSGAIEWEYNVQGRTRARTIQDDRLYVAIAADSVVALDAGTGDRMWEFTPDETVSSYSSLPVVDGTVYVSALTQDRDTADSISDGGYVYAVDAESGTQEWRWELDRHHEIWGGAAVDDNQIYVTSLIQNQSGGGIYALDGETGAEQWRYETVEGISAAPTAVGGTVYAGGDEGTLYSVDSQSGELRWRYDADNYIPTSPVVTNDTVYIGTLSVGTTDLSVRAIDRETGDETWQVSIDKSVRSPMSVVGGTLYVGTGNGYLIAFDSESGDEQWRHRFVEPDHDWGSAQISATVTDGDCYVAGGDEGEWFIRKLAGATGSTDQSAHTFEPTRDGFGFSNWSVTDVGESAFPNHNHEQVSLSEVKDTIGGLWRDRLRELDGVSAPQRFPIDALALPVYINVNQGSATNGHCYGMVYAADEYYQTPSEIPVNVDEASEISRPTGPYAAVGDDIDYYHNTQYLDFDIWSARRTVFGSEPIDYQVQLDAIREAIDETGTAGLSMHDTATGFGHQILATGYTTTEETVEVEVYDPNMAAGSHESGSPPPVVFDTSGTEPSVEPYNGQYNRIVYTNADGRVDPTAMLLTGTRDAGEWLQSLLSDVVSFATQSPVDMTVTDQDGRELTRLRSESMSLEPTEYDHLRTDIGETASEYDIELVGTDDGDYTLEVRGHGTSGGVETIEGEITEEETVRYRAQFPDDDSEELEIEVVEREDGESPDSAEGWLSNPITGVGLFAGGLGAGGLGYGLYRRLRSGGTSEDGDEQQGE